MRKFFSVSNGLLLGLTSLSAIAPISMVVSCGNEREKGYINEHEKEIVESMKSIITVDSAKKLDSILFEPVMQKVTTKEGESEIASDFVLKPDVTLEEIRDAVHINETTYLYEQLGELTIENAKNTTQRETIDFQKQFKEEVVKRIDESYRKTYAEQVLYAKQVGEKQKNLRCGSFFKSHFWEAIGRELMGASLLVVSLAWYGSLIAAPIAVFVSAGAGAAAFAALVASIGAIGSLELPGFVLELLDKAARNIKEFVDRTKCKWNFLIWKTTDEGGSGKLDDIYIYGYGQEPKALFNKVMHLNNGNFN